MNSKEYVIKNTLKNVVLSIIISLGFGYSISFAHMIINKVNKIDIYQTSKDSGERLNQKAGIAFEKNVDGAKPDITIDPSVKYQEIVGFGGAFTESAAYALSKLSHEKRQEVINAYFDPVKGLGYTLCRTHINSCDFSLNNYSYDDTVGDTELKYFSIKHDKALLIPLIKDAMTVAGKPLKIFASPWSPPAWMKTNGVMNFGGKLKTEYRDSWANYFAKYVKAYLAEGIHIWGLTIQNEPAASQFWDSCIYTPAEERDFIKEHLGPRLVKEGLEKIKLIVWDHNKDFISDYVSTILSDPDAAKYVWGTGYHWYMGEYFESLDKINEMFPGKFLLPTEACIEFGPQVGSWKTGERYGHNIIGDLNHYAVGWVDWNIVLNEQGGPNHANNFCDAPVIADSRTNTVFYNSSFYYLGHFSKFIKPGAVRIGCKVNNSDLETTAFMNTDGRIAVVVLNRTDKPISFTLGCTSDLASLTTPAHSIQTLIFGIPNSNMVAASK